MRVPDCQRECVGAGGTPGVARSGWTSTPVAGGWGVFKGDYTPRAGGRLHVIVKNEAGGQKLETDLNVERSSREKVGEPANLAILRDIAALTRGIAGRDGGPGRHPWKDRAAAGAAAHRAAHPFME